MNEVVVVDYDPEWPSVFEALRSSLWPAVQDIATSIEHVGSTSVPGLAAKPVIDMDIVVAEGDVATGIERVTSVGYQHRGDLGIPDREAFACPPGLPRHHLYLCPSGSQALANHLAIRNFLRSDESAASAYGELKKRLAREFPRDIDRYIEAKTSFLVAILLKVDFPDATLTEIERVNRSDRDE